MLNLSELPHVEAAFGPLKAEFSKHLDGKANAAAIRGWLLWVADGIQLFELMPSEALPSLRRWVELMEAVNVAMKADGLSMDAVHDNNGQIIGGRLN